MSKYVKHLTLEELAERLADELVDSHNATGIDLGYWETARELVERFYEVRVRVVVANKKIGETNGKN
jgi:homoserine dehydrogenase